MRAHALPTDFHLQLLRYFLSHFEALTSLKWFVAPTFIFALFSLGGGSIAPIKEEINQLKKKSC